MEAERSFMRPYPTGSRGREMSGNDHDRAIGEGLEKSRQLSAVISVVCIRPVNEPALAGGCARRGRWPFGGDSECVIRRT